MAVPRWLHTYWMQQLWPALSQGEVTADRVTQLLEESLENWQQRSGTNTQRPLSEQTIGRYVTMTRNWLRDDLLGIELIPSGCRALEASEITLVLQHFNPPTQWWTALNDRSRERVEQRPQILLPDPRGIVTRIQELLGKEDWAPLAVALAGATGRRVGEVIYSGTVTPKSDYTILFRGRLKRSSRMQRDFEIPTLCEAPLVLDAWERLRTHPDIVAMDFPLSDEETKSNRVLQVINQRLSPVVRKAADHYFQDLVPTLPEDNEEEEFQKWGIYTHLLRSIYRSIAIWLYCPIHTNPEAFGANILGHTRESEDGKVERLNFSTEHYYHRYGISDGRGQIDGRRGIRLGEPGVQVLEAFEKDYALQIAELSGKHKKKAIVKRTSQTGFSSIRPRVATREWFDQVAEENDLAWKDTDATLKLLLRIYEEHKQCQPGGEKNESPERVTPDQLGLVAELVGRIEQAMADMGETSFHAFLAQALDREANVQIGLAKHRLAREKADLSSVPLSKISNTRRPEAAYERIRRAIACIIDYNRGCSDPNGFWFINVTLIREYTGASPDFIRPVLQANAELLQRHHEHFKIIAAHNRTPMHQETRITKDPALVIPDDPTQIHSLSEVALPVPTSVAEDTTAAVEAQA